MRRIEDALERQLEVPERPAWIVSLVPSVTELLFDLGVGPRVAGISRYCTEPAAALASSGIARVGGQKDPDLDAIARLEPDLVLVVKEENLARDVEALAARGIAVYVADVCNVEDALALVGEIGDLCDAESVLVEAVHAEMVRGVDEARRIAASAPRPSRVFCPVWRDPWITVSCDTYIHDVLRLCGAETVVPGGAHPHAGRYPKVRIDLLAEAGPDLVLLPDEPFAFSKKDAAELQVMLGPGVPIELLDGKPLAWYGRRLSQLPSVARRIADSRR